MLDEESENNLEHKEQSDRHNQTVGDLPTKNPEIKYPVKPKDSASLIVPVSYTHLTLPTTPYV